VQILCKINKLGAIPKKSFKVALSARAQENHPTMKKFSMRLPAKAQSSSTPVSGHLRTASTVLVCALALAVSAAHAQTTPSSSAEASQSGNVLELRKDAPDSYVVVRGDTLWAISGKFLSKPWRWPEIWQLNKEQIRNPHLIYPGNIVYLDRSGATPRLRLGKPSGGVGDVVPGRLVPMARSTPIENAPIASVNMQAIRPYLTQHMIIDEATMNAAPRIFATQDGRVYLTAGDLGYVRNLPDDGNTEFQIYRKATPLLHPDTRKPIAFEALMIGSAKLERKGDPATIRIVSYSEEIGPGDRLVPAAALDIIRTAPRSPDKPIDGRILAIHKGVYAAGKNNVIAVSGGRDHGMEVGHVVAIRQKGVVALDREDRNKPVQLPDETAGHAFIFRVFEKVSYALVMEATRNVGVGDSIVNP
jgi:LysM repeat protein